MSSRARFPPVLALGAGRACLSVARSLAGRGIPVDVAANSLRDPARFSKAVRRVHQLPDFHAAPEYFLDRLLAVVGSENYELIVPINDAALAALHHFYQPLSERTRLGCPPPAVLGRVLRRDQTLRVARECGVPIPATWTLQEARALARTDLPFPVIAKEASKCGGGSLGARKLQNCGEFAKLLRANPGGENAILLQACCRGQSVGIATVFHGGRPLALFQHRRLKEYPVAGGASVLAVSEPLDDELAGWTRRLLEALEWEGPAMVEFRRDPASGSAVLMEVTGRLWGSLALSSMAGLDFPYYCWQLARGETPAPPAGYAAGVTARWTAGDLRRVAEIFARRREEAALRDLRWRELGRFLSEDDAGARDMVWSPGDPFPAVFELTHSALAVAMDAAKGLANSAAPPWLRQDLRTAREVGAIPGLLYLRARAGTGLARRRGRRRPLPAKVQSILFVCHGNLIRSALAEAFLRRELAGETPRVGSAGVGARPGREADGRACAVARELGASLDRHRARAVTEAVLAQADIVFVMDELNVALLLALHPRAQSKLRFLGEWDDDRESRVIRDPYRGSIEDVRRCGVRIQGCAAELARELREG
jgi:protein-tyrosine-phosphatase/predicted ATP-grasp superfamily ATP-dependent carboligase